MHINNTKNTSFFHPLNRVDENQNQEDLDQRQRRRVRYRGREWFEKDEVLRVHVPIVEEEDSREEKGCHSTIDEWFEKLLTIEDKIAQICFCSLEASYEEEKVRQIEEWIYKYELGGLLFTGGDFKRQSVLIDYFQSLSHIPLLIGNDLHQGLSFYFQDKQLSEDRLESLDEKRLEDIGKAIMSQNRNIGVHFQFSSDRKGVEEPSIISELLLRAFRKGILDAQGIVAEEWRDLKMENLPVKKRIYLLKGNEEGYEKSQAAKSLPRPTLILLNLQEDNAWERFSQLERFDGFIISSHFPEEVDRIASAVRAKTFPHSSLDRLVKRLLKLKMYQKKRRAPPNTPWIYK